MEKTKIKVKYIIGTYRDSRDFPVPEDLTFLIHNWYYNDGGLKHVQANTSVDDVKNPVFTQDIVMDLVKNDKKKSKVIKCIEEMLDKKWITIIKQTQHKTYYRFETNYYEK